MNLTKDKLESFLKNKESIFSKSDVVVKRFDDINSCINDIINRKIDVDLENNIVKIDDEQVEYIDGIDTKNPTIKLFGPSTDGMTVNRAYSGVQQMSEKFDKWKDLSDKIGCILGGFDFYNYNMLDKYRILSNTITGKDDFNGTLTSVGQSRHPSSHFADNNYFFNIVNFIQTSNKENDKTEFKDSIMVMRYPSCHIHGEKSYFYVENDSDCTKEYNKQREVLQHRFPPKYLWMWANKNTVIHPISLMAFRNFLNTKYGKKVLKDIDVSYTPKNITNMKFDEFVKTWKKISDKILTDQIDGYAQKTDIEKEEIISEISKLISEISIKETDMKNISDLLTTGNKAVILWGPPGTGKTYESMEVIKELLEVDENLNDGDIEDKYLFSKGDINRNEKGFYEIVQFHPNYTYQDFIGGISPDYNEKNKEVSYFLRHGKFKKFCDEANKEENKNKKFIFIIDEINRAELSAVFGELLFALEYRGKSIDIPYFGNFTIPSNIYIIGTMNNVDKSLVTFDLALRRRFGFFKLMPKLEVINDFFSEIIEEKSLTRYFEKCKQLNLDINDTKKLDLGKDYQIGQAYFLKIKDFLDQEKIDNKELQSITSFELEKLWIYNIEPLLEEYLGMSMEDEEVTKQLKALRDNFIEDK